MSEADIDEFLLGDDDKQGEQIMFDKNQSECRVYDQFLLDEKEAIPAEYSVTKPQMTKEDSASQMHIMLASRKSEGNVKTMKPYQL